MKKLNCIGLGDKFKEKKLHKHRKENKEKHLYKKLSIKI